VPQRNEPELYFINDVKEAKTLNSLRYAMIPANVICDVRATS
jgi:hypothetical protein